MPNLPLRRLRQNHGSLIITAVISAAVIMILIGGMLTFISNEYQLNIRSHKWTQALALGEAGVDLAFTEFNNFYVVGTNGFSSTRNWVNQGGGSYYRYVSSYANPQGQTVGLIWSQVNGAGTANPYIFAYGGTRLSTHGNFIYRGVECRLAGNAMFPAAMVAKEQVDMNGNNVYTDSFDSDDPTKSTGGLYDPAKRQANGDVASNNTITNSVDITLGNAEIYGRVMVSPSGAVTMGNNGSIGPTFINADRASSVAQAQSTGWLRNDFQVAIPDVVLPSGATEWAAPGAGASISDSATITSGSYKVSDIALAGNSQLTIAGPGTVRLYITGNTAVSGNGLIQITGGATLIVYAAGSMSIAGNGIVNDSNRALNNQFYGLPSSTSWSISGNGQWVGTVFAPNANLTMNGGGSRGAMSGAIVARNITLNGGVEFHYDESLLRNGPRSSFNIASWKSYRWMGGSWVADN